MSEIENLVINKKVTVRPDDLISWALRDIFIAHYKVSLKCSTEDFEKSMKPFSATIRHEISTIYDQLRHNGFFPAGIGGNDEIIWSQQMIHGKYQFSKDEYLQKGMRIRGQKKGSWEDTQGIIHAVD